MRARIPTSPTRNGNVNVQKAAGCDHSTAQLSGSDVQLAAGDALFGMSIAGSVRGPMATGFHKWLHDMRCLTLTLRCFVVHRVCIVGHGWGRGCTVGRQTHPTCFLFGPRGKGRVRSPKVWTISVHLSRAPTGGARTQGKIDRIVKECHFGSGALRSCETLDGEVVAHGDLR